MDVYLITGNGLANHREIIIEVCAQSNMMSYWFCKVKKFKSIRNAYFLLQSPLSQLWAPSDLDLPQISHLSQIIVTQSKLQPLRVPLGNSVAFEPLHDRAIHFWSTWFAGSHFYELKEGETITSHSFLGLGGGTYKLNMGERRIIGLATALEIDFPHNNLILDKI